MSGLFVYVHKFETIYLLHMNLDRLAERIIRPLSARPVLFRMLLVVCVIACVVYGIMHVRATPQYTLEKDTPHLKETSALFAREIREFGDVQAYARLSSALQDLDVEDQHGYAHTFGHQLYLVEGEKGIKACDGNFGLGCFHQFLGDAINDLGTTSVARLYNECGKVIGTRDSCKHGLGHGILSGYGYTEPDLALALELCDTITHEETYSGCSGGVFMEYNVRTIASAEGIMGNREREADLYAPCSRVLSGDRKTCLFWLPQWWLYADLGADHTKPAPADAYRELSKRCAASEYPQSCYEGIGYITPTAFDFDSDQIRTACDWVGETNHGNVYCRSTSALIVGMTFRDLTRGEAICDGLPGAERSVCTQYARQNDFSFSMPGAL